MTSPDVSLPCVIVHDVLDSRGCSYTESLGASMGASMPEVAQDPRLARRPARPCGDQPHDGLFLLIPLPGGAALRAPVCQYHAELAQRLLSEGPGAL
jgi:hypothetical protein